MKRLIFGALLILVSCTAQGADAPTMSTEVRTELQQVIALVQISQLRFENAKLVAEREQKTVQEMQARAQSVFDKHKKPGFDINLDTWTYTPTPVAPVVKK